MRTSEGLANEHLFYNVDYVVYCEGTAVDGEASSLDEVFWHNIFRSFGVNAHCKSSGSKTVVRPLAEKISAENIANVIVTMDRDYDDILKNIIDHPKVIYTYGYSWESDVVTNFNVGLALSLFVSSTRSPLIVTEFHEFHAKQNKELVRPFALDFKYIRHGNKLFDRKKPMSIVRFSADGEPTIDIPRILAAAKCIKGFQSGELNPEIFKEHCGVRRFYGKAVARLFYHWFVHRTKRMQGSRKVNYESFIGLISESFSLLDLSIARNTYYREVTGRL